MMPMILIQTTCNEMREEKAWRLPGFQNRQISVTKGGGMPYTIAAAKTPVMYIILPLNGCRFCTVVGC